jgi:hypothetical protein
MCKNHTFTPVHTHTHAVTHTHTVTHTRVYTHTYIQVFCELPLVPATGLRFRLFQVKLFGWPARNKAYL